MNELNILLLTAFSIAFFHTVLGPDHYIPFVAMAKARDWKLGRLVTITVISGLGHVLSSIVLGLVGISIGALLVRLEVIESVRGEIAGWLLLGFGFIYFVYGLIKARREHTHMHDGKEITHIHKHDESVHVHAHGDEQLHFHTHRNFGKEKAKNLTPWVLFTIFLFGPCEPLIPLLMYPAATLNGASVVLVSVVFGLTTIITMTAVVLGLNYGLRKIKTARFERYSHAMAGFAVFACGAAMCFLGL